MEEVPGIPGRLPILAPFPPPAVRETIMPSAEWEACLESWLVSVEVRLRLQDEHFSNFKFTQPASGVTFLGGLFRYFGGSLQDSATRSPKERVLLKQSYLLLKRLLLKTEHPFDCDDETLFHLLAFASIVYSSVADWKVSVDELWRINKAQMTTIMTFWKKELASNTSQIAESDHLSTRWPAATALVKVSGNAGAVLMTGSDYIENLLEAYDRLQKAKNDEGQTTVTAHLFYCLKNLLSDGSHQVSTLLDHLYFLKSEADAHQKSNQGLPTLLSNLVCSTSFLRHLETNGAVTSVKRGQGLIEALTKYRQNMRHLHPMPGMRKRKISKGKGKATAHEELHFHKAAQLSQVHELFPNLPNSYILKLLDHFNDDTEATIAALLEPDSLPSDLRNPPSETDNELDLTEVARDLAPRSTPPPLPQRRNVFDGDDFDKLRISTSRLHKGRKEISTEQDESSEGVTRRKAAIMAALARFDSDDDERDDTYDVADVGGTVDSTVDTDSRPQPPQSDDPNTHEGSLFRAWKANQEIFARDSKTRTSRVRQDLKRETNMSDEQIEGWAIMLARDKKLQDRLEQKYSAARAFQSGQTALASTKWQANSVDNQEEDDQAGEGQADANDRRVTPSHINANRNGNWGRGRGRGHGRGSSTAGPVDDQGTQAARRRKEQGRGRGGPNHNRREGRARKIGRGMAGPAAQ